MASISKRQTASGGARYDVRYRAGGRAVEESFKRRQDAENRVRQVEAEKLRGPVTDPRRGREHLADFARRWLDARLVKGRPLAPMTKQGYLGLLRLNLDATIGRYRLAEITPSVVRAWYAGVAAGAGRDQAAKSYRLLRAILNTAVDDELIARNPCRIRGGGAERADERPLIDSTLVFRLADSISARLRALVILAGLVGLRTGELLGLRWCDVDLAGRRLTVLVQAQQVVGMGRIVTGPKSEAGQRTVSLPMVAVEALEKHRADFGQPGDTGVLFTGPRGEPITRAQLSREWRAARAAAGAPEGLRVHDLRHHAATLTARMPGITTKELMARIGHASPRAALIYQHATEQRDREIAAYLDGVITEA
ncbi:MAG TPA: site-specific integrase [Acidimicrobiales bacterium]|nr:site-specific integrase [Acidimicrobiales bacterium]